MRLFKKSYRIHMEFIYRFIYRFISGFKEFNSIIFIYFFRLKFEFNRSIIINNY